ncbi:MAG: adenylosuccinate synthase [Candidatus Eisenbacteria bacterium]|uniref:Adenylosuccinate synthetase n=1 Tax=Eiseniibacteriota bacterium TaxID=2212470 RepID=A0A933SEU5_UNCEI|nr:adenylosuccinate synthase [Candidatus Eisenbacteria bacterium]
MSCTIVVGAQWGDEGKGKIVDSLAAAADVVARWQGGPNAGHSVIHQGETLVLHLVPSGILNPGCRCLIGNGVVVDLARLRDEVAMLEARGIPAREQLGVSATAHLILPYHRAVEACAESGPGAIGTTGRGIGFAYRDKIARTGLRVADLFDRAGFVERADRTLHRLRLEFPEAAQALASMSGAGLHDELAPLAEWLRPLVCDASAELYDAAKRGRRLLLEGAQGTLLDVDHGTYPFVTSSNASAAGATAGVGIGPTLVDEVVGVTKAYTTRVGHGPFPTEMPSDEAARLREAGEEYGATTGRPRRCGWLDLPALRFAVRVNGLTQLVVTKLDVLDGFDEIVVAERYTLDGRDVAGFPATSGELERVQPVWRKFPGWKCATTAARRWAELPAAAREYLEWVEREAGVPITRVSVGAGREAEVSRT